MLALFFHSTVILISCVRSIYCRFSQISQNVPVMSINIWYFRILCLFQNLDKTPQLICIAAIMILPSLFLYGPATSCTLTCCCETWEYPALPELDRFLSSNVLFQDRYTSTPRRWRPAFCILSVPSSVENSIVVVTVYLAYERPECIILLLWMVPYLTRHNFAKS